MFRWMFVLSVCSLSLIDQTAHADDWPQWRGTERDGIWRESGIVDTLSDDGTQAQWRVEIGGGYAGPAVADGKVFVMDYQKDSGNVVFNPGVADKLTGKERVLCLDAKTGKQLWEHAYDCPYEISYGNGPRCTPTVDGDHVYTLGAEGNLFCLNVKDGSVAWSKSFTKEYNAEAPYWGYSSHPMVYGDSLICLVGGDGSVAVAFDKKTGQEQWRTLSASEIGYAPPTIIEAAGTEQLLIWDADKINSLNPKNGETYWTIPLKPDYAMSIMAPQKSGNYLFASGIGNIGALMKLDTKKPGAEVVWRGEAKTGLYAANSTPFIQGGTMYGCDCRPGSLTAVNLEDGERLWETFKPTTGDRRAGHGTAFIVYHEPSDRFALFSETGDLVFAKLTPEKYEELSRVHIIDPTSNAFGRDVVWVHPAFANQSIYARNDKEIVCVSLAK